METAYQISKNEIIKAINTNKYAISSILIDDFGYSVFQVLTVNEETKGTDIVIIGYSADKYNANTNQVEVTTHDISLNDLLFADTVVLGTDRPICIIKSTTLSNEETGAILKE